MTREQYEVPLGDPPEDADRLSAYDLSAAYVAEAVAQAEQYAQHDGQTIKAGCCVAIPGVDGLDCVPVDVVTATRKGGRHWRLDEVKSRLRADGGGSALTAIYRFTF